MTNWFVAMPTSRPPSGSRPRARPRTRNAAAPKRAERYGPARRLGEVQELLNSGDGASVYDVAERFRVSVRTALRYIRALQIAGEPLYEEMAGRRKVWRVMTSARPQTITLTTAQMVALFLSRRVFDFLAGTGFKEDLDEVFAKLEAQLRRKDLAAARNLGRKVFDVNEARHIYEGRIEDVNDIVTALLREDRLRVTHESVSGGRKTFVLDPYTLVVYKKGLTSPASATTTRRSEHSPSTASAKSSGSRPTGSSTRPTTGPSSSPRERSG
jgi:hypothetical protein